MQLEGRKALVLGAGRSGVAAARFIAERGAVTALYDAKPIEEWSPEAAPLKASHNVGLISGQLPSWLLDQIDLVVISPGVPTSSIPARYVDRKDGEVIAEVELAYRFLRGRLVGVTGSNGKTTTTTLIGELLHDAGIPVQVGGNIGKPLVDLAASSREDGWTVAELSSFQLETIKDLRPNVAICMNVTPNHLDRYDSFADYAAAKHRIFSNQTPDDAAVLNADDPITADWAKGLRANVVLFSTKEELDEGLFLRGQELVCRAGGKERVLTNRNAIFVPGLHNVQNVLAAFAAGLACGADPGSMRETARRFKGVEHRIEFVSEIDGVRYYNDSKATSVDAAQKAIEALGDDAGKIVLIIGGRGKNAPYEPLAELIRRYARALVVIGEEGPNIERQLAGTAEIVRAATMKEAVHVASQLARPGDRVLLAPACASFDMYTGFEERGRDFKDEVGTLAGDERLSAAKNNGR
jgi:UDP-N-acetylmuramoylalanine--D-glutamate ligase